MTQHKQTGHNGPPHGPKTPQRLRITAIFAEAGQRLLRFPVATLTIATAALALGSLSSLLPADSLVDWFLRFFAAFSGGVALLLLMSALLALRNHDSPQLWPVLLESIKYGLISATALGLPLFFTALLLRIGTWPLNEIAWVADWSPYAFLGLGGVSIAAVLPAILVAWPYSVENDRRLDEAIVLVWQYFEDKYYSPLRLCLALAAVGFLASWIPVVGILVIPTLGHISAFLHSRFVRISTRPIKRQR